MGSGYQRDTRRDIAIYADLYRRIAPHDQDIVTNPRPRPYLQRTIKQKPST